MDHEIDLHYSGTNRDYARAVCGCGARRSGRLSMIRRWCERHLVKYGS